MSDNALLRRLRRICLALPEVTEAVKWGHPTFMAGRKMFAVLDEYQGRPCIAFVAAPLRQAELIRNPRFFAAPYAARHGWVCMYADGRITWPALEALLTNSYRRVALKRMREALDNRAGVTGRVRRKAPGTRRDQ